MKSTYKLQLVTSNGGGVGVTKTATLSNLIESVIATQNTADQFARAAEKLYDNEFSPATKRVRKIRTDEYNTEAA